MPDIANLKCNIVGRLPRTGALPLLAVSRARREARDTGPVVCRSDRQLRKVPLTIVL